MHSQTGLVSARIHLICLQIFQPISPLEFSKIGIERSPKFETKIVNSCRLVEAGRQDSTKKTYYTKKIGWRRNRLKKRKKKKKKSFKLSKKPNLLFDWMTDLD